MATLADLVSRAVPGGQQLSMAFAILLLVHIVAGLTCVVCGAGAALSRKGPGRHPRFGTVYYWALSVIFVTAAGMSILRWPEDAYLLALGTTAFGFGSIGLTARKVRWHGWRSVHIIGMTFSYIVLFTAFYVDNGPHLPLLNHFPTAVFWIVPSLIGLPLAARALARHARLAHDLRAMANFLAGRHVVAGQA